MKAFVIGDIGVLRHMADYFVIGIGLVLQFPGYACAQLAQVMLTRNDLEDHAAPTEDACEFPVICRSEDIEENPDGIVRDGKARKVGNRKAGVPGFFCGKEDGFLGVVYPVDLQRALLRQKEGIVPFATARVEQYRALRRHKTHCHLLQCKSHRLIKAILKDSAAAGKQCIAIANVASRTAGQQVDISFGGQVKAMPVWAQEAAAFA